MEAHNPIPIYIREITELSLSKWGQIKLTGFPEMAVAEARKGLRHSKAAHNPFALFMKIALEYCKTNNLSINWKQVDFLKETYKMPDNAPMLLAMKESGPKSSTKPLAEDFFKKLADRVALASSEDPFQAALAVERHYELTEDGQRFVRNVGRENPWLEKLTKADQERIVEIITTEKNQGNL